MEFVFKMRSNTRSVGNVCLQWLSRSQSHTHTFLSAECVRINAPLDREENVRGDPRLRSALAGCLQLSDVNQTTELLHLWAHPIDSSLLNTFKQNFVFFSDTVIQSFVGLFWWFYF